MTQALLTTKELCAYLGCGKSYIYETLVPKFGLQKVYLAGTRWRKDQVDALIAARTATSPERENQLLDARRNV